MIFVHLRTDSLPHRDKKLRIPGFCKAGADRPGCRILVIHLRLHRIDRPVIEEAMLDARRDTDILCRIRLLINGIIACQPESCRTIRHTDARDMQELL